MSEGLPPWEAPFVVDVSDVPSERHGVWDLYDPVAGGPRPAVVFGFRPIDALATDPRLPFVLTRVGLESAWTAGGVARFLTAAEPGRLEIELVDVPNGHHGFDLTDPGPESVAAVERALGLVVAAVGT